MKYTITCCCKSESDNFFAECSFEFRAHEVDTVKIRNKKLHFF